MNQITSNSKILTVPQLNGGVNFSEEPHKIRDNQLSDVCNMEFEGGVLRRRSGYEVIASNPEYGEILAAKEFNGSLYCATRKAFVSIDKMTKKMRVLGTNKENARPGTFIEKDNMLYYFSGSEIFKVNSYLSYPELENQPIVNSKVTIEIENDIFTDGESIYDFTKETPESYSLGQTVDVSHLCQYKTFVYGMKMTNKLKGETRFVSFQLTKGEDGQFTASDYQEKQFIMNFYNIDNQYMSVRENAIRSIYAVKDYILINLDNIFSTGSSYYNAYRPMSVKYNIKTGKTETLCVVNSNLGTSGLIAKFGDTVIEITVGDNNMKVYIRNYETGTERSFTNNVQYKIATSASSDTPLKAPSTLTMIAEDTILLTAVDPQGNKSVWKTYLMRVKDKELVVLDETLDLVSDLTKIGSNYYQIPRKLYLYDSCFQAPDMRAIRVYNFSKWNIARGMDKTFAEEILWDFGTAFCHYNGEVKRIVTSEFVPVTVDGYIPLTMVASYDASNTVYNIVVTGEALNALTNKCKLKVIKGSNSGSKIYNMVIPIPYEQVEKVAVSSIAGNLSITKDETTGNARINRGTWFVEGEELIISYLDSGFENPIRQCNLAVTYGGTSYTGASGTRLFVAGDPMKPDTYYYSDVNNFEYFPELQYDMIDDNNQAITAFAKHYQDLIVFKERSIFSLNYEATDTGALFQRRRIHDTIGCDMPGSVQTINNDVVFGNSEKGLFLLSIQDLSSERNVNPVSLNISGKRGIDKYRISEKIYARSLDFKNKYYLALGDEIYVWNYELSPYQGYQESLCWYVYKGLPASSLTVSGEYPALGKKGVFELDVFNGAENDGDKPIRAYFQTKAFDFGNAGCMKAIWQLWLNVTCKKNTKFLLDCQNGKNACSSHIMEFCANKEFANVLTRRLKQKRVLYFSFRLENDDLDAPFDISDISLEYEIYKSRR